MISKVAKFALIGGLNTVLDFVLFNAFAFLFSNILHLALFGMDKDVSAVVCAQILSAIFVIPFSFLMNHHFTFQSQKRKRESIGPFFAVTIFSAWILQPIVIFFVVTVIGADLGLAHFGIFEGNLVLLNNFAKICAVGLGMIWNFIAYHYIFRTTNSSDENTDTQIDKQEEEINGKN